MIDYLQEYIGCSPMVSSVDRIAVYVTTSMCNNNIAVIALKAILFPGLG